jgi:hypothetical protein
VLNAEDIEAALKAVPFQPLRFRLSNGDVLTVTHPDGIMVRDRVSAIAVGDTIQLVANGHMSAIEPLPAATK